MRSNSESLSSLREWRNVDLANGTRKWLFVSATNGRVLVKIEESAGVLYVKVGRVVKAEFLDSALESAKMYAEKWCV